MAFRPEGSSWQRGFKLARLFAHSDRVVQTCCLKTHRFGGHFTMSLKNAVGAVAKRDPVDGYDYMHELHGSPRQRLMIAEIALAFKSDFDPDGCPQGLRQRRPERGELAAPGLFLAAQDPVAIDAVGVAILRHLGTTPEVMRGPIFAQEQIAHAAALGVGARGPGEIALVPLDPSSEEWARSLTPQLT